MVVFKFSCGHVGRTNDSAWSKVSGFIRVAEIRNANVETAHFPCPQCKHKED